MPLLTTGCTVAVGAVTGVGVDSLGRPVGYLRVCEDRIDGATLYRSEGGERVRGSWSVAMPVATFAKWSLAEPASNWTADPPLERLRAGVDYTLYGWTSDNSSSAGEITFTVSELARLEPGQVLYWAGDMSKDGNRSFNVVVSEEDFKHDACALVE